MTALCLLVCFTDCEDPDYPASLWDEDATASPNPIIASVEPEEGTLAGAGLVTITGEGFSAILDNNLVFFGGERGTMRSASTTQLVVQAPDNPGDSLMIQVAVLGAWGIAEYDGYRLEVAAVNYGGFEKTEDKNPDDASGLAVDTDENLYVALTTKEIMKVTTVGEKTVYATTTVLRFNALRFGPDGYLYGVAGRTTIYRAPPGGGNVVSFASMSQRVYGIDFDDSGYLYAGGKGAVLYRLASDGTSTEVAYYPVDVELSVVRIFNGYVYAGGTYKGADTSAVQAGIWRSEIIAGLDTLGATELVFNWGEFVGLYGAEIQDITFAEDGDMYIATDKDIGIYVLSPPYSEGIPEQLYPAVEDLAAPISVMSWGNGRYMYVNHPSDDDEKASIKRLLFTKNGAPYYGRQ
jgi:hypothetical protein